MGYPDNLLLYSKNDKNNNEVDDGGGGSSNDDDDDDILLILSQLKKSSVDSVFNSVPTVLRFHYHMSRITSVSKSSSHLFNPPLDIFSKYKPTDQIPDSPRRSGLQSRHRRTIHKLVLPLFIFITSVIHQT